MSTMANAAAMRKRIRELIKQIPESELNAAQRYLEYLAAQGKDPVLWALEHAPTGEPLTEDELAALLEADEDEKAGNPPISHEELKKRLGLQ